MPRPRAGSGSDASHTPWSTTVIVTTLSTTVAGDLHRSLDRPIPVLDRVGRRLVRREHHRLGILGGAAVGARARRAAGAGAAAAPRVRRRASSRTGSVRPSEAPALQRRPSVPAGRALPRRPPRRARPGRVARALERGAQPIDPAVERFVAPLDQAVGIEHERRPGRQDAVPSSRRRRTRPRAAATGLPSARRRGRPDTRRAADARRTRRRTSPVIGSYSPYATVASSVPGAPASRSGSVPATSRRAPHLEREPAQRAAQLAHRRGGAQPATDDVADRDAEPAVRAARSRRTNRRRRRGTACPPSTRS